MAFKLLATAERHNAALLSFTILRLLDALPSALSVARSYWVHAAWVLQLLYFCAAFWRRSGLVCLPLLPVSADNAERPLVSAAPTTVSS